MIPARIPTQAEHRAMQRLNEAYYAPDAELMLPATLMDNLIFWTCSLVGLGIWAAAGYAAWWAAGVYAALHGVK